MSGASTDSRTPYHGLNMRVIHLLWEGPYSLKQLINKSNRPDDSKKDYGLYQVYGDHVVYGPGSLLYIGKACDQTFFTRLKQHADWCDECEADRLSLDVYLGRLIRQSDNQMTPSDETWSEEISHAEKLLIFSHSPAWNSSSINTVRDAEVKDRHVLNWGKRGSLLPEVTGAYWSLLYYDNEIWPFYEWAGAKKAVQSP